MKKTRRAQHVPVVRLEPVVKWDPSKAKTTDKVPVSGRALIQRINRKLAPDLEVIKTARSERVRLDLGNYYRLDQRRNLLIEKNVDLEETARELGVLQPWEKVVKS